ncbi:MAG: aminotransferase class III-fold pyridoxal phosphate-dependent enzyme [Candidatus Brocadiae bacterium]|nr:aminotransferase class III-fold pyridoxal phosphate-dependent enzyme [Candidatus Brocadiia bacterium]
MSVTVSQQWGERLRKVVPWGSSTCSKSPRLMPDEPGVIVRGKGCRVWDADGREYIDYRNALGPITLGYGFPPVDDAIRKQLESGILFGHPHPLEGEVAEMVCEVIPCAERARFLKTGGEAVAACIKLARYHTGREHVVQIGYNGWLNSLARGGRVGPRQVAVSAPPGVPEPLSDLHHSAGWNNTEGLEKLFADIGEQVAALVVAADYARMPEGKTFYPFLRELTNRYGAVLVFDEIVTGFRVATGGIQEYFNVTPDLAVFAKGVANGMPLSVYCGKAEIMEKLHETVVSSTYGGETLSLAAAKASIETYRNENVIDYFWRAGEKMWAGANAIYKEHGLPMEWQGFWPCPQLVYGPDAPADLRERFMRAAYANGLSLYQVSYVTFSHKDADIGEALERMDKAARQVA